MFLSTKNILSLGKKKTEVFLMIILLAYLINDCKSQTTTIFGQAFCYDGPKEFSADIPVYLRINDTIFLKTKTNFNGDYSFTINRSNKTATICIEGIRISESGLKENCGYRTCHQAKTLKLSKDTILVERFLLNSHSVIDYTTQPVLFKFNSLSTVRNKNHVPFTDLPADSAISEMMIILKNNPKIILQLSGHCDTRENNPMQLSEKRAVVVANLLYAKGVAKDRIICKGLGSERPLVSKKEISKAKKANREALHQKNRRVSFTIANFDYNGSE